MSFVQRTKRLSCTSSKDSRDSDGSQDQADRIYNILNNQREKKKLKKPSLVPRHSPIIVPPIMPELLIKPIRPEKPLCPPIPICVEPPKPTRRKVVITNRDFLTRRKHTDLLATPKPDPPRPPPICKRSMRNFQPCPARIEQLARPRKKYVLGTWQMFQQVLHPEAIKRLENLLVRETTFTPKQAREHFKCVRRRELRNRRLRKKKALKMLKILQKGSDKWGRCQERTLARSIVAYFKKQPLYALTFRQLCISNELLGTLGEKKILCNANRKTKNRFKKHCININDQVAVWMDMLTRFIEMEFIESEESEASSDESESDFDASTESGMYEEAEEELESEEGFETTEEEEEEETEEGECGRDDAFLRKARELAAKMRLEEQEGEEQLLTMSGARGGTSFDELTTGMMTGDDLALLIAILEASGPELLDKGISPDIFPGNFTYADILEDLKLIKEGRAQKLAREQREQYLEELITSWAEEVDRPKVNKRVKKKIHDTVDILAELLVTGVAGEGAGRGPGGRGRPGARPGYGVGEEGLGSEEGVTETYEKRRLEPVQEEPSREEKELIELHPGGEGEEGTIGMGMESAGAEGADKTGGTFESTLETTEPGEGQQDTSGADISELDTDTAGAGLAEGAALEDEMAAIEREMAERAALEGEGMLEMEGGVMSMEGRRPGEGKPSETSKTFAEASGTPGGPASVFGEPFFKGGIIPGHKPSQVFEHTADSVCCLTLKIYALWLFDVAVNSHKWTTWLQDIMNDVKYFTSVVRGEVKEPNGQSKKLTKDEWKQFAEKAEKMTVAWRSYSQHVGDLTATITKDIMERKVICCPKCLEDNLISDVVAAHGLAQDLIEAVTTAVYWRQWIEKVVTETARLTSANIIDKTVGESAGPLDKLKRSCGCQTTGQGAAVPRPKPTVSFADSSESEDEESLYDIEEVDM